MSVFNLNQMGKTFTQNTNSLQVATGLSTAELAEHAGLSTSTIYRIQAKRKARRTHNPTFSTIAKLALLSGVTIDEYSTTRLNFV